MIFPPNPFVYDKTLSADIRSSNIPSVLDEHYAQCGEDLIILSLLRAMHSTGIVADFSKYVCIEIGANHAFAGNNTYLIANQLGVRSILVEANPKLIRDLIKARPGDVVVHAAIVEGSQDTTDLFVSRFHELSSLNLDFVEDWHQGAVGLDERVQVPALTISELVEQYVPKEMEILFLSIDVEGMDLRLAKTINLSDLRPVFVQMEPSEHYSPGEGIRMIDFMQSQGYFLIAQTKVNLIFVDRRAYLDFPAKLSASQDGTGASKHEEVVGQSELIKNDAGDHLVCNDGSDLEHIANGPIRVATHLVHDQETRSKHLCADWVIDTSFVDAAVKMAKSAGVLSLDIFDTALTRHFDSPVDVFAEVEKRLCDVFGPSAEGFAMAREQAERIARQRHYGLRGVEEIKFDDIYLEIQSLLPKFIDWEAAKSLELNVERDCLCSVPDVLEVTRILNASSVPYIFVSDMYLPKDFLAEVLHDSGYVGWKDIYVSADHFATKSTGRIWSVVSKEYALTKLFHIGDDSHSDVLTPTKLGVMTLEYRRAKSERRVGAQLNPALLPFSKLQRQIELASRSLPGKMRSPESAWCDLGRSLGGIVLGTFVRWLAERATLHKIENLYFCARDGYLIKQAWEAAGYDKKLPVKIHYLCVSRAVLNVAAGIQQSTKYKLSQFLLSFLSSSKGYTTVKEALHRAELLDIKQLTTEAEQVFCGLDTVLSYPDVVYRFETFLQRHAGIVYERLYKHCELCVGYLRQEGMLNEGRKAIVDMGWHGNMQRSLRQLVLSAGGQSELFGFYYGLWPAAMENRYAAGVMESCFASEFAAFQSQEEVHQAVALLEQLHSAPHGSTKAYATNPEGNIEPIFQDSPSERAQYESITRWFQQGAIEMVKQIYSETDNTTTPELKNLNREVALAALGSIMLSPSVDELNLLSQIGHCPTFDHSTHKPIVVSDMPQTREQLREFCYQSDWIIGQVKHWWLAANDEYKAMLREYARADLTHFGTRVLRQFE